MDGNTLAQDPAARKAQYADGVFIRLTGGIVHDFQPEVKRAGYQDAGSMAPAQAAAWVDFCVNSLGYVRRNLAPAVIH